MQIVQATSAHTDPVAELFDKYRMFYEQPSDLPGAKAFIRENIEGSRSRIFLLLDSTGQAAAFAQLYPSPCSISMRPFMLLSDLFVDASMRRKGYARHLMTYLIDHFGQQDLHRLTLETATSNLGAQRLYESLGYQRDNQFITYHRLL